MPRHQYSTPPLFACTKEVRIDKTLVVLSVFGKTASVEPFTGDDHYDQARDFILEWNDHLILEWLVVKETHTRIMEAFANALEKLGVEKEVLEAALEEVRSGLQ